MLAIGQINICVPNTPLPSRPNFILGIGLRAAAPENGFHVVLDIIYDIELGDIFLSGEFSEYASTVLRWRVNNRDILYNFYVAGFQKL